MNFLQGLGAGVGGLLEGYQGSVDRDMARRKQAQEEADRIKQRSLEEEARANIARMMQGTASQAGFQQGPTEPMQSAGMQGLLATQPDPAAQFQDPRLAAMMGNDQNARPAEQPIAKMGTITPATFNGLMGLAAQYAGTPAAGTAAAMAGVLNSNAQAGVKNEFALEKLSTQQKHANDMQEVKNKAAWDALQAQQASKAEDRRSRELAAAIRASGRSNGEKPMSQKDALNFQIKHSNAIKGVNEATNVFDSLQQDLAYVLDPKNKAAFDAQFGVTGLQYATKYHPQNANMRSAMDRLRASAETTGLQAVKANSGGIGAMTVQEWPKMSKTVSNMSSWGSPDRARQNFEAFDNLVRTSNQNIRSSYDDAWAGTPFYAPQRIAQTRGSSGGANLQNDALAELARRRKK